MMNDSRSHSGRDEYSQSSGSGISFPSLSKFTPQDADNIVNTTACGDANHGDVKNANSWKDGEAMTMNNTTSTATQNYFDSYDDEDDGYPTDEHTINSWAQSRGTEAKRLNFLQRARDRLAAMSHADIVVQDVDADDSSFLVNVLVEDIEIAPNDSLPLDNDCDNDFLVNAQVEDVDVEQQSVGSSFLVHAGIVDSATNSGRRNDYDMYASTLSKADSTNPATLGDLISRDSHKVGRDENQSIDTYSYGRAYIDNATLGESNFTSNYSALTDDYCYDARKVGMSEAIKANIIHEVEPHGDGSNGYHSGVVDSPPRAAVATTAPESDHSLVESLPAPPPPRQSSQANDITLYKNAEDLQRVVSFGEGSGYVDEEAAMRYAYTNKRYCRWNCSWFTSSSRWVKLIVLCSMLMFLGSVTTLVLAFFWPDVINGGSDDSSVSSRLDEAVNATGENIQEGRPPSAEDAPFQSVLVLDDCYAGAQCSEEGMRCADGSTESCCGKTYNSFVCDCAIMEGTLQYTCISTDACLAPCDSSVPEVSTSSPWIPSSEPSQPPVFSDSPTNDPLQQVLIIDSPSNRPSPEPTETPMSKPSPIPSKEPTAEPSIQLTPQSTDTTMTDEVPTVKPTSIEPSQIPVLMQSVTVQASKDTYLDETDADTNFGSSERLRVDGSPRSWSLVTFDVSSAIDEYLQVQRLSRSVSRNEPRTMQALKVMNAKIRLYSLDEGGDAIVYALPNANRWAETILTWDSVDKLNRSDEFQVGSIDWVWPFDWNEVDVTDAFAMNEDPNVVISFMITTTSDNGITFASRERNDGMLSPELVITLDSAEANVFHSSALVASPTPPPSSLWPTYSPTSDD